jgi:hypothetical protein
MSVAQDLISLSKLRLLRLLALTALIVGVGLKGFIDKLAVLDPDMWWHLSVGQWIVQHRAFPHDGIFSQTAAARPWMAYSWGYEVLLGCLRLVQLHRDGGFRHSAHNRRGVGHLPHPLPDFRALLGSVGAVDRGVRRIPIQHRAAPVFFSVILFTITLTQLFTTQHSGRAQSLCWLPLIFLVWASIHIQFIYGLAVVGLFAGVNLLQQIGRRWGIVPEFLQMPTLPILAPFVVLAGCLLAACAGPYSYHLYQEAFVISQSKIIYKIIRELQALSFEYFNQYLELLLAVGAYFAIGWKKKIDPFKFALLILATIFAFRTWRDAWFLCVVAAAIIADFPPGGENI